MEHKLSIALAGILGTLFSFMMDNGDMIYSIGRWVPITLSTLYILWKWRKDIKKK